MARTLKQAIFLIVTILLLLIAAIVLIMTAEAQITFWMLRPSETASLDIVGYITALGGCMGHISTEYKGFTTRVTYYLFNRDKIVCVIAEKTPEGPLPVRGVLTTINCYSTPFKIERKTDGTLNPPRGEPFSLNLDKLYEDLFIKVKSNW